VRASGYGRWRGSFAGSPGAGCPAWPRWRAAAAPSKGERCPPLHAYVADRWDEIALRAIAHGRVAP
jgi:hypothetical protein